MGQHQHLITSVYRNKILQVLKVYREIEKNTYKLKKNSNLKCPEGCKECCYSREVEASPIELLPLAYFLLRTNFDRNILEKLKEKIDDKVCIFLYNDRSEKEKYGCTVYKLRPLICRLFGYYGVKNKYGQLKFSGCKVMKQYYNNEFKNAENYIMSSAQYMYMYNYYLRISFIGNDVENKLLPINTAIKKAIEIIQFDCSQKFLVE